MCIRDSVATVQRVPRRKSMEILRFALTAKARSVWILRQVDEGETHRDVGPAVCRIAAHCGCRQLAAVLLTVTVATIIFTSMPDVHIPHLDEDEPALAHAASASTVAPPSAPHRRHSVCLLYTSPSPRDS